VRVTCLKEALVLVWLLRRAGITTTLRIGVARHAGDLQAHAWLEHDGRALGGLPANPTYEPLLPADGGVSRLR
jgi:hypothetical protein